KLEGGVTVKVIAGEVSGEKGPVRDVVIDPEYLDVSIPPESRFIHRVKSGHTLFAYVTGGRGFFCKEKNPFTYEVQGTGYFDLQRDPFVGNRTLVLFDDGEEIEVFTENEEVNFLLISGKPIREPIAWFGPIVMNTQEELGIAFDEYRKGSFLKHKG
ncbi:MAG: pirin-like C-terminal cupin domain-containing protein, partial [Thermodesulfobacteriota bacterium]